MDILDLEMKQHSSKMDTLKEQLQQMEEQQEQMKEERQRELQEQKQNIQTDSTIQDLENMVMRDLSYNVPVEYYENPWTERHHGEFTMFMPACDRKNAIKKTKKLFDIIKEENVNSLLPNEKKISYEAVDMTTLPDNIAIMVDAIEDAWETSFEEYGAKVVTDALPDPSIAETSDKFVAILNIVKQQDARIKELEKNLST